MVSFERFFSQKYKKLNANTLPSVFYLFLTFENMISGDEFIIQLGVYLRQLRERKELSQQNLADMCNLPKSTIARIERAEMNTSIKTLVKIANALEIAPKALLDFQIK